MCSGNLNVWFSHGQESGPWGHKISAMAELARDRGCAVDSIDYRDLKDPTDRVARLVERGRDATGRLLLVGSSMGGHVAAAASGELTVEGLFLIAPAFFMPGYEALTPAPRARKVCVVHGWSDEVVPVANSIRWATSYGAELHLLHGDHRLTDRIDAINRLFAGFLEDLAGR